MFVLVGKFSQSSCWWVSFVSDRGSGCVVSVFVLVGWFCQFSYWWWVLPVFVVVGVFCQCSCWWVGFVIVRIGG